jgi:hypothetical protein
MSLFMPGVWISSLLQHAVIWGGGGAQEEGWGVQGNNTCSRPWVSSAGPMLGRGGSFPFLVLSSQEATRGTKWFHVFSREGLKPPGIAMMTWGTEKGLLLVHCCDNMPEKINLKRATVCFGSCFRGLNPCSLDPAALGL